MRFVVALVIAIAAAGCCGDDTSSPGSTIDLSMPADCPTTIDEGQTCRPECHYLGYPCGCSASNVWTCPHRDMTTTD
jgi:hypothetical protein